MTRKSQSQDKSVVYLIDDDDQFRKSLRVLLQTAGYSVREFPSAESYLEASDKNDCGCIVLDLRMPGMGGKVLQHQMHTNGDPTPIIIVTAYASVPATVEAMKRGAVTVLEKPFDPPALLAAVEQSLARDTIQAKPVDWTMVAKKFALSPRQVEMARFICKSYSNEQIGKQLGITTNTVRMHIKLLYEKLDVKNRVGVAMRLFETDEE